MEISVRWAQRGAAVVRGIGAAFGVFIVATLAARSERFDPCTTWTLVPAGPRWISSVGFALVAVALIGAAFGLLRGRVVRTIAAGVLAAAVVLQAIGAGGAIAAALAGRVRSPLFVPNSLVFAILLLVALHALMADAHERSRAPLAATAAGAVLGLGAIPVLLMMTYGPTDYARPADCAVVLGARVYPDGSPSLALSDRVDEAIRLHQRGLVRRLLMTGGVDRGTGQSEPRAMAARALEAGVPRDAILIDEAGDTTAASARNTAAMLDSAKARPTALVVSHYYHLPRVKLLFERNGVHALTVPAHMSRRLAREPWFLAREIAAFYHSLLTQNA
jgi:vancomycin permeability regulator SanA